MSSGWEPTNLLYLDPPLQTPGVIRKLDFLSAIVVSPSSGVLWFWPLFSVLGLSATAIGIHRLLNRRDEPHAYLPVLSVTGVMLVWFAGLSAWFSPFGWIALGPRLEVPLLGELTVAYVHTAGDAIISRVRRLGLLGLSGVVLLLVGSIQLFAPWRWYQGILQLIAGRGSCPDMTRLDIYGNADQFYRCAHQFMWRIQPSLFDDIVQVGLAWSTVGWVVGTAACLALWFFIAAPRAISTPHATQTLPRVSA